MKTVEYVYSNPEYVSKVNDFGDDYHKPESEYDACDKEVLRKLRSMKRTYRDPNEFCEIKTLYIQYTKDLIAKYGGKKRFKKLYALGFIKDYIPFCPVLRRIKKNKYFYKDGEYADEKLYYDYHLPSFSEIKVEVNNIDIVFKSKGILIKGDVSKSYSTRVDSVNNDLDIISQFYQRHQKREPSNLSKKEYKREALREKYIVDPYENMSMTDRYKSYLERKASYRYDDEEPNPDDTYIYYKDSMLSKSEVESIEIYEAFKHIGFGNNINMLSKKSRKVVKNNKRRVKFGKKKKKKTKYLNQYTGGTYETYEAFENAMIEMVERERE